MPRQISLRLPDELARRLDRLAAKRRMDRSLVVREAIQAYLVDGGAGAGRPLDRVRDLAGSLRGGPPDLAAGHREYLRQRLAGG
ncbi:MAG TPA: ribbon-helix-helix domain-containing protein [Gemmatimonadales bacterium]